jgi:hypothetical protein
MFTALGEVLDHPLPDEVRRSRVKRTGQPVRRHSRQQGREGVFWRPTGWKEMNRIITAAKRYERTARPFGARRGPLGGVAIEILELFANIISHKTGRLDPSIDYLMRTLNRSRDAIVRALKALRTHGFLDWLRRYVPTGAEGRGPQVQQTSNAYRLSLPARAARLLSRMGLGVPVPDDHSQRQQQRKAELDAHEASLSNEQRALFLIEDESLAASLARLGAALDAKKERESAKRSESLC